MQRLRCSYDYSQKKFIIYIKCGVNSTGKRKVNYIGQPFRKAPVTLQTPTQWTEFEHYLPDCVSFAQPQKRKYMLWLCTERWRHYRNICMHKCNDNDSF